MEAFEPENLKGFDAVVFNNTTNLKFTNPKHRAALLEFVRSGKGIMGLHAAADCFYDWKEGAAMMGGCAAGHPWMKCAVKLDDPQHPLLAAFGGKGFYFADEMYKIKEPYSREHLRVLLSFDLSHMSERDANAGRADKDNPVAWIHEVGQGRVFYSNIGHIQQDFFQKPIQEFFLDALQYVIGDLKADATPSAKLNPQPGPALAPDQGAISQPRNERGDAFPSVEEMKTELALLPRNSGWPDHMDQCAAPVGCEERGGRSVESRRARAGAQFAHRVGRSCVPFGRRQDQPHRLLFSRGERRSALATRS